MVRRDVERFRSYFVGACAYSGGIVLLMELRHLRYFVAVAEEQNVSRAAKRLHVSQPPLSRQIRDLETEMSIALFERSSKAIRLTEAGQIFLFGGPRGVAAGGRRCGFHPSRCAPWNRYAKRASHGAILGRRRKTGGLMKILVLGATGGVGREIVRQGLEHGHEITAFVRARGRLEALDGRLTVVEGDLLNSSQLDRVMAGQDIVASGFGPRAPISKNDSHLLEHFANALT